MDDRPTTPTPVSAEHESADTPRSARPVGTELKDNKPQRDGKEAWEDTESELSASQVSMSSKKDGDGGDGADDPAHGKATSRFNSVKQRMKSPLMGTLNLEEIRDTISKNVEVK